MESREFLGRRVAMERENGVARARTAIRLTSLCTLAPCIVVSIAGALLGWRSLPIALPSGAIGAMLAERNSLESRIGQWPEVRGYIDWSRVEKDWTAAQ
jgi:hypothetical protein